MLAIIEHREDLLGDPGDCGFGSLLFDAAGRLHLHDANRTWLYTAGRDDLGRWTSFAREFDVASGTAGPPMQALGPTHGDARAVIHHVIAIRDDLYLALLSDGRGVRAAVAETAAGPFRVDSGFHLEPGPDWERRGESDGTVALEANAAFVPIEETDSRLEFWAGYDSYHAERKLGDIGWIRLVFDKREARIVGSERHPDNPLRFREPPEICARCGGNLAADVLIDGRRPFFFYTRTDLRTAHIRVAFAADPLFFESVEIHDLGAGLGHEEVMEKFQCLATDGILTLIYESRLDTGRWCTGWRRYRI